MDAVCVALLREVLAGTQWPSASRRFATVLSLDGGDPEMHGLAHEALIVAGSAEVDIDTVQQLVSAAAGENRLPAQRGLRRLRDRFSCLADQLTSPLPARW